jgi:hypothetical protein
MLPLERYRRLGSPTFRRSNLAGRGLKVIKEGETVGIKPVSEGG